MEALIQKYKDYIIQVSTPYGSGSGFYIKGHNLIATNRHVIQGCSEVVIRGEHLNKTMAKVLFTDSIHDIALLECPSMPSNDGAEISNERVVAGQSIIAIGHPLGLKYTATKGIVSKEERIFNNIKYIQIDAAINPGNSGGPLINDEGKVVGINTFIIQNGESLGFAVPAQYLNEVVTEYKALNNEVAIRCSSCSKILTKAQIENEYCPNCGNKIDLKQFTPEPYRPVGIAKTIENILNTLQKNVELSRVGQTAWDIEEGSALIKITYDVNSKFLYSDVVLCSLPKDNIAALYEYLLKENYNLENISFSIYNQNIILGCVVYEDDLDESTGIKLFKNLFEKADYYDDLLINQFNALPIERDE